MELFFAGATKVEEGYPELQKEISNRLISYHYQTPNLDEFYYHTDRDKYKHLILDSGAFSAWSQGAVIDIEKYADYCLKWQHVIDTIVNLDVIPAKPGVKRIKAEEIERSASKGFENYQYLLDRGVDHKKVVHVFHQNENFKWLEKMLDDGMEYIGLSPANDRTVTEKKLWLDDCMKYVTDSEGKAIVKFHGFAVTSFALMRRYPWYSIDSSTWAVAAGRGTVMVPHRKDGDADWDFDRDPMKLLLSQVPGRDGDYTHLTTNKGNQQKNIDRYIKEVGLAHGKSDFKCVPKVTELKEDERWCSNSFVKHMVDKFGKKENESHFYAKDESKEEIDWRMPNDDERWLEEVQVKGVYNYWKYRQYLNAVYINTFVDNLNKKGTDYNPTYTEKAKGFGVHTQ